MELTLGLAFDALQKIFNNKKFLLIIGTGASCALDHRFGMPALAKELKEKVPGEISTKTPAMVQWKEVEQKLDNGKDRFGQGIHGMEDNSLVYESSLIWAVYQDKADESNSIIKNNQYKYPLIIKKSSIWQIDTFAKEVLLGETNADI